MDRPTLSLPARASTVQRQAADAHHPHPPRSGGALGRPGLTLAIVVIAQLMLILDATVMNVALPRIRVGLGFSSTGLAWVLSAYTLTFGGLLLLGGRAGDILGRRRAFVAGVAVFTVASLLGGLATSPGWLIGARILQGVGAAAAGPNTIALVTTTFTDPQRRVRALAVLSAVSSAGFAIGLIVGGLLTEVASWRWVLFINVPFGVAVIALAPRYVREPDRHPARLDIPGAVAATAGVAATVYGLIHAASAGWSDTSTLLALGTGIALLVAFVLIEARSTQPLMPLHLFADRNRRAGFLLFFVAPASMMSMFFFVTQFLQQLRGFSALATGLAFLPLAVGMFSMTRLVPHLLSRFGPKPLAVAGTLLTLTGLALLTRLDANSGYAGVLLAPMLLMGFGGGLAFVPLTPVIMGSVQPRDTGAAGGALQTMQQTGASLGLAVLVTVFGHAATHAASGGSSPTTTLVSGMTAALRAATLIAIVPPLIALTFRTRRSRRLPSQGEAAVRPGGQEAR